MKCRRCETLKTQKTNTHRVYVSVPTKHHEPKFEKTLKKHQILYEKQGTYYLVNTHDFIALLKLIEPLFNTIERKDIKLLPLTEETLTYEALDDLKSLTAWLEYVQAEAVRYVLENRALTVYFQPIIDHKDNSVYAHEALIRGIDKVGEIIAPNILFEQAKQVDLLFQLDELCRTTIIKVAAELNIQTKLFINFTPTAIYDPVHCLKKTDEAVTKYNLNKEIIVFEVIESERIKDYAHLDNILKYYKARGYQTALDDVGSGYTTLDTICALKPDLIKIDQSIIRNIETNQANQKTLNNYINTAKAHDMLVLAEGVETKAEYDYLKTLNIDYMQGYYLGKPKPTLTYSVG